MPPLDQGRIVWADVADLEGRNRKCRPVVILTLADQVPAGEPFIGVAVTTRLEKPLPNTHILLPYHPKRNVMTRLSEPSAAVCNWLVEVWEQDIQDRAGVVPPELLDRIIDVVNKLADDDKPESLSG